ncbi:3' exoribonuclease family, domain 1 domain-containing protein [Besnoitia besnoiti]|uniref:3' exoribonuclease family, domain 1 domain-containing protein n=1 Tax=Besnoitia besnoiti TaxID=94643 RepID=A0A2A9MCL0_BESBE|nr:3' exoribonuclease family, domain 1 domain-containing protein [Besnoitia besnoiti]PFH36228.1 3' exoribonuclease family, domain 1 domain-containing protein [Besnoitia besnoiti]
MGSSALKNFSLALSGSISSLPLLPCDPDHTPEQLINAAKRRERHDGRSFEEMRAMCLQTRSLAAAAGSAFVSVGKTKLNCAVYGPRPTRKPASQDRGYLNLEFNYAPFSSSANEPSSERDNSHLATLLHQSLNAVVRLEKYPKSTIDVCVMVLEDDGGVLAAALTCIGLALSDAGIEMLDIVTGAAGCAVSLEQPQGPLRVALLLDPDADEVKALANKDFTLVEIGYCPALSSVCFLHATGPLISSDSGEQLLGLCEAACNAVADEVRACLRRSFCQREEEKAAESASHTSDNVAVAPVS